MPQPSICEIRSWHFWIKTTEVVTSTPTLEGATSGLSVGVTAIRLQCADCGEKKEMAIVK